MDRRHFIATSGLVATSSLLSSPSASGGISINDGTLSKRVNFVADGLDLTPAEYVALLQETTARASIAPDNYSLGGCIAELEQQFARTLGKEAAMFVPTGTLANHIAVRSLAGADRRVLVQAESHLLNDSGDCAETLSGLKLIPLAVGKAMFDLDEVQQWVERSGGGRVRTPVGVISIENPVRRRHHEMIDFGTLQRVSAWSRERGIRLHLDGARMFSLPHHSGKSVRDHAALFDTVYVSLWKHFNGASGAILAGSSAFIDGLFHTRRMFGGALPHAWPLVAAVPDFVERFEADYAAAWEVANAMIGRLTADGRFTVTRIASGTSRFMLNVAGADPAAFAIRALQRGIKLPGGDPETGHFILQVNPSLLRTTAAKLASSLIESLAS